MSFFDFGPLFGQGPRRRPTGSATTNDDPIVINIETDGEDAPSPSGAPPTAPPRITRRAPSGGSGRGYKIVIGVVLALAVVVGLFFAVASFATDVMWYDQLGFSSVVWTLLGTRVGLWIAYALLMVLITYVAATLEIGRAHV